MLGQRVLVQGRMSREDEIRARFRAKFGTSGAVYRAPGRVNLIGEHTDYNDGFVLPAAIGFFCWTAIAPREDRRLVIHSENFNETITADLDALAPLPEGSWGNYPLGVAWALQQAGKTLRGANIYIAGNVPLGAGLSSSAAIEVATGYALLDLSLQTIDLAELALLCQRAENEFTGARCGIMDQFISCRGEADHAMLLDCRTLATRMLPLPENVALIICNTMVKHELGASEYNTRRAECEEAAHTLHSALPDLRSLRDVNMAQLEEHRYLLSNELYKRARHVVSENLRVQQAADALQTGAIEKLSRLMADSHRSLRDDYEVSCPELDAMVEIAARQRGVLGARMTGGGFGGCTINLVDAACAPDFQHKVAAAYTSATGLRPDIYVCEAAPGVQRVPANSANTENLPAGRDARENS
ncbi:MAG TPA: galactokinase [Candidatus Acidoferrum sp.]